MRIPSLLRGSVLWFVLSCLVPAALAAAEAPVDRTLTGDKVCTRCHDESEAKPVLSIYQTPHGVKADGRTPGCQSCHGASEAHVKNAAGAETRPAVDVLFGKGADAARVSAACVSCHQGGARMHWPGSAHQTRDVTCTNCHKVHAAHDDVRDRKTQAEVCYTCHAAQRAQSHRISAHPLKDGKMACSDCHNPHGSIGPKLLIKATVNETCYTCHADRRGPFLWEHQPVTDDCSNCHTPHGSNNAPLLKAREPWLCQECHSANHARTVYSGQNLPGSAQITLNGAQDPGKQAPTAQLNGRSCSACHAKVHGSNHPAGAKFNR